MFQLENGFELVVYYDSIINAKSINNLFFKFNDDVGLRSFFIDNTYADILKKYKDTDKGKYADICHLLEFVKKSKIIPVAQREKKVSPLFNYIMMLADKAKFLFNEHLNRNLDDVCEKAEKIKVLSVSS